MFFVLFATKSLLEVFTHHVAINSRTGTDLTGKYIESLDFQVFIEDAD